MPAKTKKSDLVDNSDVSDIDVDDYGDSSESEYDSDELDQHNTENPHGFMYGGMLETFQKGRKERIADHQDEKETSNFREKFKKNKHSKMIGKSEKVHQKNKPFMMLKKKKLLALAEKMGNTKPVQKNGRKDK